MLGMMLGMSGNRDGILGCSGEMSWVLDNDELKMESTKGDMGGKFGTEVEISFENISGWRDPS